jgi:hypothetical protein
MSVSTDKKTSISFFGMNANVQRLLIVAPDHFHHPWLLCYFHRNGKLLYGKRDGAGPLPGLRIPPDRAVQLSMYVGMQVLSLQGGLPCKKMPGKSGMS